MPRVEQWLAEVEPDVLCLQETKSSDDAFPALAFRALGYDSVHHGEGRWNGVAILSRVGVDEVVDGFAPGVEPDPEARLLTATCGGLRVATVYVPNGREVGHEHWHYKLDWLRRLRSHLERTADPAGEALVVGDFNVAPDDRDVWDATACHGGTHVSPEERAALRSCASGAWSTSSASATTRTGSSRGGTTGPATSTSTSACASTSCWRRRRWQSGCRGC
jgi:exodeoxyribonuclease-3